MSLNSCYGLL